jgi:hypothetical protein
MRYTIPNQMLAKAEVGRYTLSESRLSVDVTYTPMRNVNNIRP